MRQLLFFVEICCAIGTLTAATWKDPKTKITWHYIEQSDGTVEIGRPWEDQMNYDDSQPAIPRGTAGHLDVPDLINGRTVTSIGDSAFYGCKRLTSVSIPTTVSKICWDAFQECYGLKPIYVPSSVTHIKTRAFSGANGVRVAENNPNYSSDGAGVLFNKDKTVLLQAPHSIKTYAIPNSVQTIGEYSFQDCPNLVSVNIPGSVREIQEYAFASCVALRAAHIPRGVETIGYSAFDYNLSLKVVTFAGKVQNLAEFAFVDCIRAVFYFEGPPPETWASEDSPFAYTSGKGYYSPEYAVDWQKELGGKSIGVWQELHMAPDASYPTYLTAEAEGVEWKYTVKHGEAELFAFPKRNITAVSQDFKGALKVPGALNGIPVTSIAAEAFRNCASITSVAIPATVKEIGRDAFAGCGNLSAVVGEITPRQLKDAFWDCPGLKWTLEVESVGDVGAGSVTDRFDDPMDPGASVRIAAKPNAGYAFAGWYTDETCDTPFETDVDFRTPSFSYTDTESLSKTDKTVRLFARFVAVGDDVPSVTTDTLGSCNPGETMVPVKIEVSSKTLPKVSVKGLPAGVKFNAKTLEISGTPTKPGEYDIAVSVTNAAKQKSDPKTLSLKVNHFTGLGRVAIAEQKPGVPLTEPIRLSELFGELSPEQISKIAVSGLPGGMKYNKKDGVISGVCQKPGAYTVYFRLTEKNPDTRKNETKVSTATFRIGDLLKLDVAEIDRAVGTVRGSGAYPANKKVTLSSKPAKGYVFAGWYTTPDCKPGTELRGVGNEDFRTPSLSYLTGAEDRTVYARFAAEGEDRLQLSAGGLFARAIEPDRPISVGLSQCVESVSLPRLMVKGLPPGLEFDAKTLMVTGKTMKPGIYSVVLTATNATYRKVIPETSLTLTLAVANLNQLVGGDYNKDTAVEMSVGPDGLVQPDTSVAEALRGASASGLPKGLKWNAKEGCFEGAALIGGTYTVTFKKRQGITTMTLQIAAPAPVAEDFNADNGHTHDFAPQWPSAGFSPVERAESQETCYRGEKTDLFRIHVYEMPSASGSGSPVWPTVTVEGLPKGLRTVALGLQDADAPANFGHGDLRRAKAFAVQGVTSVPSGKYSIRVAVRNPETHAETSWEDALYVRERLPEMNTRFCAVGSLRCEDDVGGGSWMPVFADLNRTGNVGSAKIVRGKMGTQQTVSVTYPFLRSRNEYLGVSGYPWWEFYWEPYDGRDWPTPNDEEVSKYVAAYGNVRTQSFVCINGMGDIQVAESDPMGTGGPLYFGQLTSAPVIPRVQAALPKTYRFRANCLGYVIRGTLAIADNGSVSVPTLTEGGYPISVGGGGAVVRPIYSDGENPVEIVAYVRLNPVAAMTAGPIVVVRINPLTHWAMVYLAGRREAMEVWFNPD